MDRPPCMGPISWNPFHSQIKFSELFFSLFQVPTNPSLRNFCSNQGRCVVVVSAKNAVPWSCVDNQKVNLHKIYTPNFTCEWQTAIKRVVPVQVLLVLSLFPAQLVTAKTVTSYERHWFSNHWQHDCFLNKFIRMTTKKSWKITSLALCTWNSQVFTVVVYWRNMWSLLSVTLITPGPRLNIKTIFPRYGDSHVKDKTVARLSYL